MKKIILILVFATTLIYVCLAFITIQVNPFLWSENLRILFVCSSVFLFATLNKIADD